MEYPDNEMREAIAVVLAFVSAMNDWEIRRYYRSRVDHGYEFTAERDSRLAGPMSADELDAQYLSLFGQYCTDRKRKYGGFPGSFSAKGRYCGISENTVVEVIRPKPARIELICTGGEFPDQQYKFVVFKTDKGWLIDNAYTRNMKNEWDRCHL